MTTTNTTFVVTDDAGTPSAVVNNDELQTQATLLAYDVAEHAGDPEAITTVMASHLVAAGPGGFGYVAAAALRILAEHVLNPVLEVTDQLHRHGHLQHDLRAGLGDAARNARESLT